MAEKTLDVVGLGALNIDRLFSTERVLDGGETVVSGGEMSAGGSSANTVYGLAKLGLSCGFVGAVGDDDGGRFLLAEFESVDVDTSAIARKPGPSGTVYGFITADGERSLYVLPGANSRLDDTDIAAARLTSAGCLIAASFADPEQLDLLTEAFLAVNDGTKRIFTPGAIYSRLGLRGLKRMLEASDLTFLNSDELTSMAGTGNRELALEAVHRIGCPAVVLTLGAEGSLYSDADGIVQRPARAAVAVDTTGAGDSFAAGFIKGWLAGSPSGECLELGSAIAAACIASVGARSGLPDEAGLRGLLGR